MVAQACDPTQLSAEDYRLYQLGKLIEEGIPYAYPVGVEPDFTIDGPSHTPSEVAPFIPDNGFSQLWRDGQAKDFPKDLGGGRHEGLPVGDRDSKVDPNLQSPSEAKIWGQPSRSLWWSFAGRQYRVTKALMIPYAVKDAAHPNADKATGVVTRHLLVGYMGVDPSGG